MIRTAFAILLIVSLVGLGVSDAQAGEWKTFALGLLYGVANVLIFLVR